MKSFLPHLVLIDYNNNIYKISNIDWDKNPKSTFERKGKLISLMDYYLEKGIRIDDRQQSLLDPN